MLNSETEHLVIVVYAYSLSDPVFSHQRELCIALSRRFLCVTVIADFYDGSWCPDNLNVIELNTGCLPKSLRFLELFRLIPRAIKKNNRVVIFSFMTETHSIFTSLMARCYKVRHVLWYAHASTPFRLKIAARIVDVVLSSTIGSMALPTPKAVYIGQGIDEKCFEFQPNNRNKQKWIYWGRLDKSKRILEIGSIFTKIAKDHPDLSLTFIGSPTSRKNAEYINQIRNDFADDIESGILVFEKGINRTQLPRRSATSFGFLHSFNGSLDKSLLEAVFMGIHVVTTNLEFIREFGTFQNVIPLNSDDFLEAELRKALTLSEEDSNRLLIERLLIARENHSFTKWERQIYDILTGSSK